MRLGVISDTHDRVPAIRRAAEIFNEERVDAVLHCGDFVAPFALLPFRELCAPLYAVFGNNDGEKAGITALFERNGWTLNDRPHFMELGGARIAMLHEPDHLHDIAENGEHDLIVFGHTHKKHFDITNGSMIVNPGEACGWVKGEATAAILDLDSRDCRFVNLA